MNPDLERQLIQTCIDLREERTTTLRDAGGVAMPERYTDPVRFQREIEQLFRRLPAPVAHSREVAEPNSYQVVETALGSLVVTRDPGGRAHVLRNACRHRGAQVAQGNGCAKRLTCPYHAWSYSLDGQLASVPGKGNCFPDLVEADNGLIEVPSVEKYGLVWVCPEAQGSADAARRLDDHLGEMADHLVWMDLPNFKVFQRSSKVWQGNWKLFAEGGLETYHFAYAHKGTIAPYFYNNTAAIDQVGRHFRVVMPTKALDGINSVAGEAVSLHDYTHTLFLLENGGAFLVQEKHVDWILFRPIAADQTEIITLSLIPADADLDDEAVRTHWQKNHDITNMTLDEDWALGASIQASLASGALPHLQYGRNEWALRVFGDQVDEVIGC